MPLYLSEIAPVHIRGQLNIMFQLSITIGILVAQIINYGTLHALLLCTCAKLSCHLTGGMAVHANDSLLVKLSNSGIMLARTGLQAWSACLGTRAWPGCLQSS